MTISKIRVPESIQAAQDTLCDIDGIVTAKNWTRAAIVYAFVTNGGRGGDRSNSGKAELLRGKVTFQEFAARGISGLSRRETVARYHDAWAKAVEVGEAEPATPGMSVTMPDRPFPASEDITRGLTDEQKDTLIAAGQNAGMTAGSKVADIAANKKSLALAIQHDAETAETAASALPDSVRARVAREVLADPAAAEQIINHPTTRQHVEDAQDRAAHKHLRDTGFVRGVVDPDHTDTQSLLIARHNMQKIIGLYRETRDLMVNAPADDRQALRPDITTAGQWQVVLSDLVNGKSFDEGLAEILDGGAR